MSRRARMRAQARPWQNAQEPAPIDWDALAAERARREQQQAPTKPIPSASTSNEL